MKEFDIKKIEIETKILKKINCDFCKKEGEILYEGRIIEGFTKFNISPGFGSKHDMETYDIDICDDCLENVILNNLNKI